MAKKAKKVTPMDKLTRGYEKFIKDKELNQEGKSTFNKTLKKASKGRSSK